MFKTINYLGKYVGMCVFVLLTACGSKPPAWNISGKWIDRFAQAQACGAQNLWDITLNLNQTATGLSGKSQLIVPGENGPIELTGSFSGNITNQNVQGIVIYTKGTLKIEINYDLLYQNGTLKGSFTTSTFRECPDTSRERISGNITLITRDTTPVQKDIFEPNNTFSQAKMITPAMAMNNLSISSGDVDWFKFEVKASSRVIAELELLSDFPGIYRIFSQSEVSNLDSLESQVNVFPLNRILQKGTYYIAVSAGNDKTYQGNHRANGRYLLRLTIETFPDSAHEPNETKATASDITLNFSEKLYMSRSDGNFLDVDWFKFEITNTSLLDLTLKPQQGFVLYFSLQSSNGFSIRSDVTDGSTPLYEVALEPDTYYLAIGSAEPSAGFSYDLTLKGLPIPDESFEPNNTRATASSITLDFIQTLFLFPGDEDWLSFNLSESQVVSIDMSQARADFSFELYQEDKTLFSYSQSVDPLQTRVLGPGQYFFRVFEGFTDTSYTIKMKATPIPDLDFEPNNSFNQPSQILLPLMQTLALDTQKDEDWFRFDLAEPSLVTASITKGIFGQVTGEFYTLDGKLLGSFQAGDTLIHSFAFETGSYIVRFYDKTASGFIFDLDLKAEPFSDTKYEPNNTPETARAISLGFSDGALFVVSRDHPSLGDEDWFSFSLNKTTQVAINIPTDTLVDATLYDAAGNLIGNLVGENDPILLEGTYLIHITSNRAAKYGLSVSAK